MGVAVQELGPDTGAHKPYLLYNIAIYRQAFHTMQKVSALHSWISNLPPSISEAVLTRMQPRHYDDGEAVYLLGEEGSELYMVKAGKVRFCNYTPSGKEIQIGEMRVGDCFGELSLIDGLYRASCAYAQGPVEILVLQKQDFDILCGEHLEIPMQLARLLSHRLRMAYTLIEDASVLPMKERLARLLGRLGYSVGIADADGVIVLEGFTHEGLARMLGSTREAITRELKHLEWATLIQRRYGKILIPNIATLIESGDSLIGGEPIVPDYD